MHVMPQTLNPKDGRLAQNEVNAQTRKKSDPRMWMAGWRAGFALARGSIFLVPEGSADKIVAFLRLERSLPPARQGGMGDRFVRESSRMGCLVGHGRRREYSGALSETSMWIWASKGV